MSQCFLTLKENMYSLDSHHLKFDCFIMIVLLLFFTIYTLQSHFLQIYFYKQTNTLQSLYLIFLISHVYKSFKPHGSYILLTTYE